MRIFEENCKIVEIYINHTNIHVFWIHSWKIAIRLVKLSKLIGTAEKNHRIGYSADLIRIKVLIQMRKDIISFKNWSNIV